MICDFCSGPNPNRTFTCQSFIYELCPLEGSQGDWMACDPCAAMIDADNWQGLAERAADTFIRTQVSHEQDRALIVAIMRDLHDQFRKLRLQTQ